MKFPLLTFWFLALIFNFNIIQAASTNLEQYQVTGHVLDNQNGHGIPQAPAVVINTTNGDTLLENLLADSTGAYDTGTLNITGIRDQDNIPSSYTSNQHQTPTPPTAHNPVRWTGTAHQPTKHHNSDFTTSEDKPCSQDGSPTGSTCTRSPGPALRQASRRPRRSPSARRTRRRGCRESSRKAAWD